MGSLNAYHWMILAVVIVIIYAIFKAKSSSVDRLVCKSCGFVGWPKSATSGSIGIEILLWLCLILPGLIYSIWRLTSRHSACPKCGSREMIPVDSPVGKKLIAEIAEE